MLTYLSSPETIAALVPEYTAAGDHTLIYTIDGGKTATATRVATLIRQLARTWAVDLAALKNQTATATQRTILQPLPICPSFTLVPVKVRIPRVPGDSSIGYINTYCITNIEPLGSAPRTDLPKTIICLQGGGKLPCFWTSTTVHKALQQARLITRSLQTNRHSQIVRESTVTYDPHLEPIAHKLVEVFYDILRLKQNHPD